MSLREWLLIISMVGVTFAIRYSVLALSGRFRLSERLLRALNYVPPAVLVAIIVPAVLVENETLWVSWENPRLIGAIAALGIGCWRQNLLLTIVVGMGTFWVWQAIAG